MYRFIIERSDKIVHLRGQKYSLAKKTKKIKNFINAYLSDTYENKHNKEHLFHQ